MTDTDAKSSKHSLTSKMGFHNKLYAIYGVYTDTCVLMKPQFNALYSLIQKVMSLRNLQKKSFDN